MGLLKRQKEMLSEMLNNSFIWTLCEEEKSKASSSDSQHFS